MLAAGSRASAAARGPRPGWKSPGAGRHAARARGQQAPRAAAVEEPQDAEYAADDFYQILGVSPRASGQEIKAAYRSIMKGVHPDISSSGDDDDASNDFAALVNEIYATLIDPEQRATYDAIAGFAAESVNPFLDASYERDQVFVDEFTCIGCRNCTAVCPSSFAIEDDWGRARVMAQGVDSEDKLQEAIDTCPVSCIHWVTAPQLSLLEAAMQRMERVAVWALMAGNGSGKDVFREASLSWEKRQAAVRAKLQAEASAAATAKWAWAAGFGGGAGAAAGASFYSAAAEAAARRRRGSPGASGGESSDGGWAGSGTDSGGEEEAGGGRARARTASLAARAARAARQHKAWQEMAARRKRALLVATTSASSGGESE